MHGAGQRLSQRGMFKRNVVGNVQSVLGDDASRNADEFCIGAVVEEQIVAEIFLAVLAEITLPTWRRVQRYYAVAAGKAFDSLPCFNNGSGQFVTKECRRARSCGHGSRGEKLEVRSTGQSGADATISSPGAARERHVFNANILAAVQDRGLHGSLPQLPSGLDCIASDLNDLFNGAPANVENFFDGIAADLENISDGTAADLEDIFDRRATAFYRVWHYFAPQPETGSIIIFIESALGCDATSIAATASSIGKR